MATKKPATYHCPATRWSLDDLVAALPQHRLQPMSRSSLWRILEEADLKPHRSVYWLNSHDPDFEAKAHDICQLYVQALRFYQQGRLVICADEKTGMQILQRALPHPARATGQTRKTRARVHPPWRARVTGLLRGPDGPARVESRARPAPVRIGPPIWPTSCSNCPRCSATIGWSIISIPTGASRSAGSSPNGVHVPYLPQGLAARRAAPRVPERSDPSACLPLYAQAWVMAQSSRVVV